ncbi:hypothetical protein PM082_008041 [Marasmius tenuissimus]|nr:hypothetical protein PM082_008041 [Marasmius tenuissimus]
MISVQKGPENGLHQHSRCRSSLGVGKSGAPVPVGQAFLSIAASSRARVLPPAIRTQIVPSAPIPMAGEEWRP